MVDDNGRRIFPGPAQKTPADNFRADALLGSQPKEKHKQPFK